jgi:hypothetical protein
MRFISWINNLKTASLVQYLIQWADNQTALFRMNVDWSVRGLFKQLNQQVTWLTVTACKTFKFIAGLWCEKRARDFPNKKQNYRHITAMLRDAVRESHKQIVHMIWTRTNNSLSDIGWGKNKTASASDWASEDFSALKYVCFSNYSYVCNSINFSLSN